MLWNKSLSLKKKDFYEKSTDRGNLEVQLIMGEGTNLMNGEVLI